MTHSPDISMRAKLFSVAPSQCWSPPTRNKETASAINAWAFPSIPGVGPRTGSRILAEIGGGSRFGDRNKLVSLRRPKPRYAQFLQIGRAQSLRGNHQAQDAMFFAILASLRSSESKGYCGHARSTQPAQCCAHLSRLPVRRPALQVGGGTRRGTPRHPGLRTVVARLLGPA